MTNKLRSVIEELRQKCRKYWCNHEFIIRKITLIGGGSNFDVHDGFICKKCGKITQRQFYYQ